MKKIGVGTGMARAYALAILTIGAVSARAEPVVVSGGTWSAAGVTEGADVVVSGETENDIDGLSVNSLTFTGSPGDAVSLSGKGLTVVSAVTAGQAEDATDPGAFAYSCNVPITAGGALTWSVYGTNTVFDMNASLDFGTHGLTLSKGQGTVNFRADNSGTGPVTLAVAKTYLYGPNKGMGDPGCVLKVSNSNARLYLAGTTLVNETIAATYATSGYPFACVENTTNEVRGLIANLKANATTLAFLPGDGGVLTVCGGLGSPSATTNYQASTYGGSYMAESTGTLVIEDTPWSLNAFGAANTAFGCGDVEIRVPGMDVKTLYLNEARGAVAGKQTYVCANLRTTVDWVFNSPTMAVSTRINGANDYPDTGNLDITSTRQRIGSLHQARNKIDDGRTVIGYLKYSYIGTFSGSARNDAKPVLYIHQIDNAITNGIRFIGDITLVKEGDKLMRLTNPNSTTAGGLRVAEGRLELSSAARWANVTEVTVGKAADDDETLLTEAAEVPVLALEHSENLNAAAALSINGEGTVELGDGVSQTVDTLTIDGELMPAGKYSATICPDDVPAAGRAAVMARFSGRGNYLDVTHGRSVVRQTTSWTGNKGTMNWSDPENWSDGVPGDGCEVTISVPAAAGATPVFNNDLTGLAVRQIAFIGAGGFELQGNPLTVGEGGLTFGSDDADATAVTNVIRCNVTFTSPAEFHIHGTGRELWLYGSLALADNLAVDRDGSGVLRVFSDNDFNVNVTLREGKTFLYGERCAFGTAASQLEQQADAALYLSGAVLSNGTVRTNGNRPVRALADTANRICGDLTMSFSTAYGGFVVPTGASLAIGGAVAGISAKSLVIYATEVSSEWDNSKTGTLTIERPISVKELGVSSMQNGMGKKLVLGGSGTSVSTAIWWKDATLEFRESWTFGTGTSGLSPLQVRRTTSGSPVRTGGALVFNGTEQRLGGFADSFDAAKSTTASGTAGSVFRCYQTNAADTWTKEPVAVGLAFTDALSFVKEGPADLVFTNAVSTTTGYLAVTEGKLTLAADATWANCTDVRVTGGTLSLSRPDHFARRPSVLTVTTRADEAATGAKVELNFDDTMRVETVLVDGQRLTGLLGGPDSGLPAAQRVPWLVGRGVLKAGGGGTLLLVR